MKTTIQSKLLWKESSVSSNGGFQLFPFEMESCGYITVCDHEIEVEVPDDFDPRAKQVEILRKEKQRINAEFAKRVTQIDEQINRLTAIEA